MIKPLRIRPNIWWALYFVWGILVSVLLFEYASSRDGGMIVPEDLLKSIRLPSETTWMGIYLNGQKIGFTRSELTPLEDGGYEISEISQMQAAMMGTKQQMSLRMNAITDSVLALVYFDGEFNTQQYSASFKGEYKDKVLKISITTGGRTTEKVFPSTEPLYLSQAIKPLLQGGRLHSGDSLKLTGFDPIGLQMQDLIVVGADFQQHILFGKEVRARKLLSKMENIESAMYVDEQGDIIAEFGPLGLVMRRESAESALTFPDDTEIVDFLNIYSIKPTGVINNPRECKKAVYKVKGFSLEGLSNASNRQLIISDSLLSVNTYHTTPKENINETHFSWLKPSPLIESDAPEIVEVAKEIVRGGKNSLDTLGLISDWIFSNIKKKPSAGLPSAMAVLKQREGDCNEHSVLFTAMARAIGFPSRIVMGLVYQDGKFYYHAWTAAFVDGQWYEFDPTFGQRTADAARIALISGDLSTAIEIAPAIGKIEIDIINEKLDANDE